MNGFSWITEGEIAGMARPSFGNESLWQWLSDQNVGLVVSLTLDAPSVNLLARFGLEGLHLPIEDFTAPNEATIDRFLEKARFYVHEGRGIVVHCTAGRGRTGTMLACHLVASGLSAQAAIDLVREKRPGSIETAQQEKAVIDLARRQQAGA
ncbi:MAG: phosphatase domain-containing protein [Planctomycetota bacterium]